ncbi:chemotaxis protein CheA [Paenibacillus sambharensis]|uniref:Chemotaxis protein CheA n=2 Tax=Paenibacillus sambharensis TaxID=1803190 RepID=A0A2W1LLG7_9BACL|nr:chemotaxis protein CheA [Paenibacillus sambharensis]
MAFFLAEVDEQLFVLEQEILRLEEDKNSPEIIQTIFRVAHTLKGSSAAMGFDVMKQLTHEMENVLDKIRHRQMTVNHAVVNVLFRCLDHLGALKKQIETEGQCSADIAAIVKQLHQFEHQNAAAEQEKSQEQESGGWMELNPEQLKEAVEHGFQIWICEVHFNEECEMRVARGLIIQNNLNDIGRVLAVCPPLVSDSESAIHSIRFAVAAEGGAETLKSVIDGTADVQEVQISPFPVVKPLAAVPVEEPAKGREEQRNPAQAKPKAEEEIRKVGQTIRVDVERLENLMNLVGELVIDQTRIAQVGAVLGDRFAADETVDELEQISNHISRVIGELQESVMKTRMLPIEQLFNRFPRMVRDLSQTLDKEINLIIEGKETELDRTVIEEIGDPLIHLIRNAIDHGVEDADQRRTSGKPVRGTIRVTAHHQENQVVITVEDDGAGIDAEKIKQSALRKELITAQQAENMKESELVQLVFLPGFSTAKAVSDISGRGVGMDIVRSHIEKLNGIIDVETSIGEGTTFTIKLPLTLAILRGLLIKLAKTTYALPMSSVIEIMRLPHTEIDSIKGQNVVKVRDKVIPLVWLHDAFHLPRSSRNSNNLFIVIVGSAEKRLGLVVDELIGNQEIVVKSMGSYIGKLDGVSGATILGDGSVALILDVTGVFKLTGKESQLLSAELPV